MKKGILFDLDGVLVNSMPSHLYAWQWAFDRHQIPVDKRTLALHEGFRSPDMAREIAKFAGITLAEEQIKNLVQDKRAYYQKIAKVEFFPHSLEVIHAVKAMGKQCAIVTSCVRTSLHTAVPPALMVLFDYIITGEDIRNGKPSPDPFLIARDTLRLTSDECVVVENAPLGIQAAKAAGMICIAITTTLPAADLADADYIVQDISEILPIITKLN
ncbi:HAD family phosphatase [candidate division KSB1 bacterium]|nr:HAD family phosphatase [candidate division KSB1 bacterium]